MRLASFLACAAIAPLLTAATEPLRIQPSGPWVLDYADQSCRLGRKFGVGETETFLLLESVAPDEMDMLLVGPAFQTGSNDVRTRFLPNQVTPDTGRHVTVNGNQKPGILYSNLRMLPESEVPRLKSVEQFAIAHPHNRPPPVSLIERARLREERQQFATAATELEVKGVHDGPVILETGSMRDPIKMFDKCSRDSLKDWGVDPEVEDTIVQRAWLANWDTLIEPGDYPPNMVSDGQQSEVKVRVLIDAKGQVTKCTPLSRFKLADFTQLVCDKITRKGKFLPAELADGTKVASYYNVHFEFRLGY